MWEWGYQAVWGMRRERDRRTKWAGNRRCSSPGNRGEPTGKGRWAWCGVVEVSNKGCTQVKGMARHQV